MEKVRVGIIGCGMIAHRHMTIYTHIPNAEVVAVSEIKADRLKAFAEQYGIPEENCYQDFREMLKRDDLDTIDVCVHNNLHAPVSIAAMKAGFDVYCEKPIAATSADAQMMIDCAKKLGRKFHVQISSLMNAQTRVARDMIANGELGDVYFANLTMLSSRRRPGYDLPQFTTDFYTKELAGHGPTIDLGVYLISQLIFVLGMPELQSVSGFATRGLEYDDRLITNPYGFGVEDFGVCLAKFKNGVNLQIQASSAANINDQMKTYILGSKGGLEIIGADTTGGPFARAANADAAALVMGNPALKFYGNGMGGEVFGVDLNVWDRGLKEARVNPEISLYDDNQVHWIAYKTGVLTDETRYNTPEIAKNMLMITDGLFLSSELKREVTAEEIKAMVKPMALTEQETPFGTIHYDLSF